MQEHREARFIVDTLTSAGFLAYYAGGWVRDLLLNQPSDDIDIATNAPPETVQALFPHTVPIGISFGIILVLVDGQKYEVATFRRDFDYKDARRPSRIEFATAEEDAKRRDFTINGMFYDPIRQEVIDFVGGKKDLEAKIIRAVGNPHERIKEDRLRMIRAIRLSCRFQFQIEPHTAEAIRSHSQELFPAVAIERVVQELLKAYAQHKLRLMLISLDHFGLLSPIFPELSRSTHEEIVYRLHPTKDYPQEAPLIAPLLSLFPHFSVEEALSLCKRLKLSNEESQFCAFLMRTKELLEIEKAGLRQIPLAEWAHFYANHFSTLSIQIIGCHVDETTRETFYKEHTSRMGQLTPYIERIRNKDPLVKAKDLIALGIPPGKTMGLLLEEADHISINEQILEKEIVLNKLRLLPLWPI